ncbi:RNA polymerase sigma factor [Dyadobacter fermentans]|uniref:RNA polymerase, sigma-24 subunit, ECF subfamily n=1 Tax=Dyadobacter fermentans (strain ATCC 700827 / DSM 18053 / CIP 107007 / KCTC 52180 / NS114) TaxID=471854 RepID=C6W1C1_DYAFD|nr:RNA polymerase sigma-70 factor [Dyadobacter fermentans]ACT91978.1 RNA polymerase, sigma-24 subunit, ECF subfamily [Dyadobacter fermentans DSM 18053]
MDNYQGCTDSALLALIAEGDELAFAEVYRRYKGVLFLHARRILGNDEEGKDVLQELFTTLWTRRTSIDLKTNLCAYLYASVRNRVFDIIAHRKVEARYIASLAAFIEQGEYVTDQQVQEKELRELIEQEIALLPPKMREVFELSRKEELSYKEIADQLHISDKTVKKQVNNALHILREKLDTVFTSMACFLFF